MDDATRKAIEDRAHALWEEAGRPDGSALLYWLRAEQDHGIVPTIEADDRLVSLHELAQEALEQREAANDALPDSDRVPSGAEDNPTTATPRGTIAS